MPAPALFRHRLLPALLLGLAGLLVNLLRYEIFFNVDLIFGSVFVMLVILHVGEGPGVVAALIAGSATWILWNHPWAMVIFGGEALFVGWLVRRRSWDLLLADLLFWGALGIPLIWVFYHLVLRTPVQTTALVFLKQAINGIINALLACILHLAWRARSRGSGTTRPTLRSVVFVTMVSLVTFPALLYLTVFVRQEVHRGEQEMVRQSAELDLVTREVLQT